MKVFTIIWSSFQGLFKRGPRMAAAICWLFSSYGRLRTRNLWICGVSPLNLFCWYAILRSLHFSAIKQDINTPASCFLVFAGAWGALVLGVQPGRCCWGMVTMRSCISVIGSLILSNMKAEWAQWPVTRPARLAPFQQFLDLMFLVLVLMVLTISVIGCFAHDGHCCWTKECWECFSGCIVVSSVYGYWKLYFGHLLVHTLNEEHAHDCGKTFECRWRCVGFLFFGCFLCGLDFCSLAQRSFGITEAVWKHWIQG